jgi:hypothetical protein
MVTDLVDRRVQLVEQDGIHQAITVRRPGRIVKGAVAAADPHQHDDVQLRSLRTTGIRTGLALPAPGLAVPRCAALWRLHHDHVVSDGRQIGLLPATGPIIESAI